MPSDQQDSRPSYVGVALRGASLASAGLGLTVAITLGGYVVLARILGPADFGAFAAASVVIGLGSGLAESGVMAALIQREGQVEEAASTAAVWSVVLGLGLAAAAAAVAPLVGMLFESDRVAEMEAALAGVLALRAITVVPDALLQRRFSFLRRVVSEPLGALAYAGIAIWLALDGAGPWSLVAGSYASILLQSASAWGLARWRPRLELASRAMWREIAGYSRYVLAGNMIWRVGMQLDTVAVGRFLGTAPLGQYRNGWRLAYQPVDVWIRVGAYVLLPTLSRVAGEPARMAAAVRRTLRWMSSVLVPVCFGMLALGTSLATVALGHRWHAAGRVVAALSGMFLGQASISLGSEIFKSIGRPRLLISTHLVYVGALIAGLAIAAPIGIVEAAVAVSAASLLAAAYNLVVAFRHVGLRLRELRVALAPLVAAAVMAAVLVVLDRAWSPGGHGTAVGVLLLIAEALTGLLVYTALLLAIDGGRRRDIGALRDGLRARRAAREAAGLHPAPGGP